MNVVIGDENDNSPIMEKSEIELNLRENMAVGVAVLLCRVGSGGAPDRWL